MVKLDFNTLWQSQQQAIVTCIHDLCLNHANGNNEALDATGLAEQFSQQLHRFVIGELSPADIRPLAQTWAAQGLTLSTAGQIVGAAAAVDWAAGKPPPDLLTALFQRINLFQLQFLEALAEAREEELSANQETTQNAMHDALETQLERQRLLRQRHEQSSQELRHILQLNASLARNTAVKDMLAAATSGICRTLDLVDVTIYQYNQREPRWSVRTSTAADLAPNQLPAPDLLSLLKQTVENDGEHSTTYQAKADDTALSVITLLQVGDDLLGAIVARIDKNHPRREDVTIFVDTFAFNLAALWQNLQLFQETHQRAHELEILHGRYIDSIWQTDAAAINATYEREQIQFTRDEQSEQSSNGSLQIPIVIGEQALGRVMLPVGVEFEAEETDFAQALIREMGNALNNAQLLQTTRTYSKQLQVAAKVSHAASTILDRDRLIQEVVDLIRSQFDLYYVALFLVDKSRGKAVLHAGSGQSGQTLVREGFELEIGGNSMVGTVAATGHSRVEGDVFQARVFHRNPLLPDTRSEMALPLQTATELIGVLTVQSSVSNAFSNEDLLVFQTLTDQLTTAIQNASLFARLETTLEEAGHLYQTSRRLTAAGDETAVYEILVDFAAESGLVDLAHIAAPDDSSSDYIVFPVLWDRTGLSSDPKRDRFHRDRFPFADLLQQNELIIVEDERTDPRLNEPMHRLFKNNNVRSSVIIPIQHEGQWLASLVLDREKPVPLSESEMQPFLTLVDQAAIILANRQLLKQTDALYQVSQSLNQAITREDAIETVVMEVARQTAVNLCRFIIYEPNRDHGHVIVESIASGQADEIRFPMEEGSLYSALGRQRQPLLLGDEETAAVGAEYLDQFGVATALLIPVVSQQQLWGFLALDNVEKERPISPAKIGFIQNVLEQLTTTIESLKLFDDALQRAQEMVTLNQIGSRISGTLDLNELANIVYREVNRLVDSTLFTLARFDNSNGRYEPLLSVEEQERYDEPARTLRRDEPLYRCLYDGQPRLVRRADQVVGEDMVPVETASGRSPQSWLWVPIQRNQKPIALIMVHSYQTNAYDDNHLQLLRTIGTQAGLAMTNAELFQETQSNVAELRELFRITQAAASSIDTKLRIENVTRALFQSLRSADVAIMIADNEAGELTTLAKQGRAGIVESLPLEGSLAGEAVRLGQPLLVNDLRELKGSEIATRATDSLSQLVVPLNLGQRSIGVINAMSPAADAFTERDLRLLQTVSASLAATIESGRLFEDVQAANEQLREMDRLKTQFLANMSHELRTPLNSIIGFSRIMLKGIDGPITEMQEEDLGSIHSSGQHLLGLINEILDLAKIEAGRMTLAFEKVNVNEMAVDLLAASRGLVQDKDVELVWDIEPDLPAIEADVIRLRQILLNFLSNAAKFTEKGHIRLQISRESEDSLHFSVADTGSGIAEKDFHKLFEAFQQVDASPTRATGGTGLGLSITQRLVHMHRGEIWFESEIDRGSIFHIILPLQQGERVSDTAPLRPPTGRATRNGRGVPRQATILLVDDEPGVIGLYRRYLNRESYQLLSAYSGSEALQALAENQDSIEVIVLDVNMPDINGWELLSMIRSNKATCKIPVIICSVENDPEKAAALGAQMLLTKPILEEELLNGLESLTKKMTP